MDRSDAAAFGSHGLRRGGNTQSPSIMDFEADAKKEIASVFNKLKLIPQSCHISSKLIQTISLPHQRHQRHPRLDVFPFPLEQFNPTLSLTPSPGVSNLPPEIPTGRPERQADKKPPPGTGRHHLTSFLSSLFIRNAQR